MKKERIRYSSSDFLVSDLPNNHKDLFKDVLKNQWHNMMLIAFIVFVAVCPLIIHRYINMINISKIIAEGNLELYYSTMIVYSVVRIFLYLFVGLIFAGLARIYKKLAYNDGFFFGADFIKGVKENWKEFLLIYFMFGILAMLFDVSSIELAKNSIVWTYFLSATKYIIIVPVLAILMCLSCIYTDKLRKKIVVAFKLYIRFFPKLILALLAFAMPLSMLIIANTAIQLFIPMFYALIYLPIAYLGCVIFMNYIFDIAINEKNFPDLVGKGMWRPNI